MIGGIVRKATEREWEAALSEVVAAAWNGLSLERLDYTEAPEVLEVVKLVDRWDRAWRGDPRRAVVVLRDADGCEEDAPMDVLVAEYLDGRVRVLPARPPVAQPPVALPAALPRTWVVWGLAA